jgi:hypothetical protein
VSCEHCTCEGCRGSRPGWAGLLARARLRTGQLQSETARRLAAVDPDGASPATWQAKLSRLEAGRAVEARHAWVAAELARALGAPELAQGLPVVDRRSGRTPPTVAEGARVKERRESAGWTVAACARWCASEYGGAPDSWRRAWGAVEDGRDDPSTRKRVPGVLTAAGELFRHSLPSAEASKQGKTEAGESAFSQSFQVFGGGVRNGTACDTGSREIGPGIAKRKPRKPGQGVIGARIATS